eukprot:scaffold214_cov249-Pinguiococcus_pyrenoidosus.AAC.9
MDLCRGPHSLLAPDAVVWGALGAATPRYRYHVEHAGSRQAGRAGATFVRRGGAHGDCGAEEWGDLSGASGGGGGDHELPNA